MECKLIFSKATNKYILALPVNFNPDALSRLRDDFAKINDIPKENVIVLPQGQGRNDRSDTLDGYTEL